MRTAIRLLLNLSAQFHFSLCQRHKCLFKMSNILVPLVLLLRPVDAELEFVLGLWSAGEAGPKTLPYPNDKNLLSQWTRGGGRLTEVNWPATANSTSCRCVEHLFQIGMRRMFDLGRWLRQRYIVDRQFLTSDYNPNEVSVWVSLHPPLLHTIPNRSSLKHAYPLQWIHLFLGSIIPNISRGAYTAVGEVFGSGTSTSVF